jgi:hypothetical protein
LKSILSVEPKESVLWDEGNRGRCNEWERTHQSGTEHRRARPGAHVYPRNQRRPLIGIGRNITDASEVKPVELMDDAERLKLIDTLFINTRIL